MKIQQKKNGQRFFYIAQFLCEKYDVRKGDHVMIEEITDQTLTLSFLRLPKKEIDSNDN